MVEELDDMTGRPTYDAVVVGAGPNGLTAAVELARNGCSVAVVETESTIGARSAELNLPGYFHDLGSAIHPFGYASPYFRSLPLEDHALERPDWGRVHAISASRPTYLGRDTRRSPVELAPKHVEVPGDELRGLQHGEHPPFVLEKRLLLVPGGGEPDLQDPLLQVLVFSAERAHPGLPLAR
jgi:NAD(P)-binding Rossmann-like domain